VSVPDTPHFNLPFSFGLNGVDVVEQDTLDDVANCVVAILVTHTGFRDYVPEFGSADYTFRQQPIGIDDVLGVIGSQEPRAVTSGEERFSRYDTLIDILQIKLSITERTT